VAAKIFSFFLPWAAAIAQLTPLEVSLLIRIYSDFIPESHSKPAFFGCE
jgi:hypothetical protein